MSNDHKSQLSLTVFTSDDLPINIVQTRDADEFYRNALGSNLMEVPKGKAIKFTVLALSSSRIELVTNLSLSANMKKNFHV
jgi:hypothetical protein